MKLLLIRNDNIGDLACTTPLLEVLRKAYPEATIDFFGNSYNVDLVRHDPRLTRVWSYQKAKHVAGLVKKTFVLLQKVVTLCQLRSQRYDLLIIAVPVFNKRTMHLARWIGAKTIYGAATQNQSLPSNYKAVTIDPHEFHVLQVLSYARALGIKEQVPETMSLFLSEEEKQSLPVERSLVAGNPNLPIVGLQISARRLKQRWSYQEWKKLIALLLPYARLRLLWSPGAATTAQHPGDDELATQLASTFPTVLAKSITNLRGLMIAFSTCDFVVGADGGAMHVAAALDIPTVTLFGDIDSTVWRPYSKKGTVLESPTDTLQDLDPAIVAKKVIEIIQNNSTV